MREKYLTLTSEITIFLYMFFTDLQSTLLAVGFLIMADTFTGLLNAFQNGIKKHGFWRAYKSIESGKAQRILFKLILYPLAIIVTKVAQDYLAPMIPLVDVTAGILAMIEIRSIFENIGELLGFDLWERIKDAVTKQTN